MDKPIKKYRAGSIDAAIWLNSSDIDGTRVEYKSVTLRRSWRDKKTGVWRDEHINLRKTDIQKVLVVMQEVQKNVLLSSEVSKNE
ncbi:hypothetical protein CL622_05030 [archaeon]|nr:hypothetical protein [archaeon]